MTVVGLQNRSTLSRPNGRRHWPRWSGTVGGAGAAARAAGVDRAV